MKYKNKETGVILEPRSEIVENQLRNSDQFEEVKDAEQNGEKPVEKMNKAELMARATELNITVPDGATNDAIKALIRGVSGQ